MHPDNVVDRRAAAIAAELRVHDAPALLALDLPERPPLLGPIFARERIVLLRGSPGRGKSWLALSVAHAAACGGALLGWAAPAPARVLYVDAGMPLAVLKARVAALGRGRGKRARAPARLRLLAADAQPLRLPDLATAEGRAAIERLVEKGVDMLVLDSLAALVRVKPHRPEWLEVTDWLASLRRRGLCVVAVERSHAHRRRMPYEEVADAVLALTAPADFAPADGARFELEVEAARGLAGADAVGFEAWLTIDGGAARWRRAELGDADVLVAWRLYRDEGYSLREVAVRMDTSLTRAWRLVQKADAMDPDLRDRLLDGAAPDPDGETGENGETGETAGTPGTGETESGLRHQSPAAACAGPPEAAGRQVSRSTQI